MQALTDLIQNYLLISAGVSWFVAQICKVFTGIFHERHFSIISLLTGTGGMPSSHSACVTALAVSSGLYYGLGSAPFAITTILALVVMRDASGVRREAGKQAKVLNQIIGELFTTGDEKRFQADLKELLGHTPLQVFVGAILGAVTALALFPAFR
ncbi:MAG: divergent PAP2 family protein [Clostridia bacterium]|nr:divergent PAP2 family protein [Clostridia bacterium]